jgi:hypothetical protein
MEQKVSIKDKSLDRNSKQQMNSRKKKLKNQMMALKQQLKNVLLVTWDSPDGYLYDTCFKMA